MKNSNVRIIAFTILLTAVVMGAQLNPASAQTAPTLGAAQSFAVLAGSAVTNTGPTIIAGDLGVSPGTAVTGFPPGLVTGGAIHAADAQAQQAKADLTNAYTNLAGQACNITYAVPTDLGGRTLPQGVYCFSSSVAITGTLTLDGSGDPAATWVFKVGSTLITATNSTVVLVNGAQQCNDSWQVGSSATLGTNSTFVGNILALTSITLNTGTKMSGRALARNGAVTLDDNAVSPAACAVPPPVTPTLDKAFSPATINATGISLLTITLHNSGRVVATLTAPLIDSLPTGVLVSGSASNTCGGTITATAGSSKVTLTGGSIPSAGSCTVTVQVTAANGGSYFNSLAAGALRTSNGNNVAPAVAGLTVNTLATIPPTISKAFNPATINAEGISLLTITLHNSRGVVATLTAPLIDSLPTGVLVSGSASNTCGGTVTADTGSSTVTLTGGWIPAGNSCKVTVKVTAANRGNYINSVPAGGLKTSTGNNAAPAIATLSVNVPTILPPTLSKAFSPAVIYVNGISHLIIMLNNPNGTVAKITTPFTDTFPTGVNVYGNPSNTCGGTATGIAGSSKVTLSGGSIPANGSCTVAVDVTSKYPGCCYANKLLAGTLQTDKGSNTGLAVAMLVVNGPPNMKPSVHKDFAPTNIAPGGISGLTITLFNPTGAIAKLTAPLIDTFPAGMFIAGPAGNTCGGTATARMGGSSLTLTGGSIPAKGSCSVKVLVTAKSNGSYVNMLSACSLQTDKGCNSGAFSAVFTVGIKLSKTFSPARIGVGGVSLLTITLHNPGSSVASMIAPLTDKLPSGLTVSGNIRNSCGGTVTAPTGGSTVTLTGGSIPARSLCSITVNVTAAYPDCYYNMLPSGALQTNEGSNTAPYVASVTVN